ncbi:MAG: hypothetical protein H6737_09420 [Alphaproteobacteria bacterium]|nr:hypothetical protein [Alphaproteobacteria bacterium]
MQRADLHPGLVDMLRADPDDLQAIGILADWLEEQGEAAEAEWLQDHLHGMAGVFRERSAPEPDLLGAIDPRWLGLRHGLIRTLRVPQGFDAHAARTCRVLAELPLALGLVGANVPDGPSARAWMPHVREHLADLRTLRLGADVDPAWLEGFDGLKVLGLTALAFDWSGTVKLPALDELAVDVRGDRLDLLDHLAPAAVARLELTSASWAEVSHGPLVAFLGRVPVQAIEMRGRSDFAFRKPLRNAGFDMVEEADFGEPLVLWERHA